MARLGAVSRRLAFYCTALGFGECRWQETVHSCACAALRQTCVTVLLLWLLLWLWLWVLSWWPRCAASPCPRIDTAAQVEHVCQSARLCGVRARGTATAREMASIAAHQGLHVCTTSVAHRSRPTVPRTPPAATTASTAAPVCSRRCAHHLRPHTTRSRGLSLVVRAADEDNESLGDVLGELREQENKPKRQVSKRRE